MMSAIQQLLEDTFGFTEFRGNQAEIIQHVLRGDDGLVIMPTGGGKSLCYQLPALHMKGLTVVVSPLIALMDDQVAALQQLNISAGALHSNIGDEEASSIFTDIRSGTLDLLYVSPERLLSEHFLGFLKGQKVAMFAIDEAHCVSVWGNDFRPEYVKLSAIKQHFPHAPVLALTATADHATRADILHQLQLPHGKTFISSFERKNITAHAKPGQKRLQQMVQFINNPNNSGKPGIVYCLSRKSTEKVAADLQAKGLHAEFYHAGVPAEDRKRIQTEFQNDNIQIICATIAFGMGIDKPNIAWVIHYNLPKNIEGYYQEIGRAGRDGSPAETLLFYSWRDFTQLQSFIDDGKAEDHFKELQTAKLQRMWQFATAMNCRTNLVLNYFGEYRSGGCQHCDNCLMPPTIIDRTIQAQMALSAMVRAKQQLGLNTLIGVLRGSQQADILEYQDIKTYGAGKDTPFEHWRHYIHQLLNLGLIRVDFTDSSRLKLTPLSEDVLMGKALVKLAEYVSEAELKKIQAERVTITDADVDTSLLGKLKEWRKALAKEQEVPAFVIFSDKTLTQVAGTSPTTEAQLLAIDGIGPVKLEKYGADVLRIVAGEL